MNPDQRPRRLGHQIRNNIRMPVLPSSHPDDAMPHTPNDGAAGTTAGNWPPRGRDPQDPSPEPADTDQDERAPERNLEEE